MTSPPVRIGDVAEHLLAAVAEARRLDRQDVQDAAQLVDHQGAQRLAVDVLGDDHQLLAALLDELLQDRQHVVDRADLLLGDQDVRLLDLRHHPLGVGDEVRGDVATVEQHALGVLDLELEGLALLDGDDAVLADLLHRLGEQLADLGIVRGDGGDPLQILAALDRRRRSA